MRERYKSIFFAILSLTVVWFLVLLLLLPQATDNSLEQWAESPKLDSLSSSQRFAANKKSRRNPQPFDLLDFVEKKPELNVQETLFYQFNHKPNNSLANVVNLSPINHVEHEEKTKLLCAIKSSVDFHVKSQGFTLFAYNLLVSNRIGLIRSLPDTRHAKCSSVGSQQQQQLHKSTNLSTSSSNLVVTKIVASNTIRIKASVIICYYNEAPSALLRTIYSVLKQSPIHLVKEIIVVDDFSNHDYNYNIIRPFIDTESTARLVTLVRTSKREGLIRARLFGAQFAKGDVLVFLDSHVEANIGWLEPLLATVQANKTTIACPMIDLINAETLIYTSSPMVRGGLNWALNFKWDSVPSEMLKSYDDFVKPIETPTMAGGLYAIDREYFYHLGAYDSQMDLWGGENVELSLRAWMCGGKIVILPCSRVGHIFRKKRPYGPEPDQPDSLLVNSLRTARVWLGEDYIEKFHQANSDAKYLEGNGGDISERLELKQKLNCHNFSWFLDNVYPTLKEKGPNNQDTSNYQQPKPTKLFNFKSRRLRRTNQFEQPPISQFNRNRLQQRQAAIPHASFYEMNSAGKQQIGERLLPASNFNNNHHNLPKMVAQYQIQSANSNLCIELKSGFIAKGFTRLILNRCAVAKSMSGVNDEQDEENLLIDSDRNSNHTSIHGQLWTETELQDYRIGDNQCLDLLRNLPILRKCHHMGSFQSWTRNNRTVDANIYNYGGRLCLGVERVQVGEPIIVTICDRQIIDDQQEAPNGKFWRKTTRLHLADNSIPIERELEHPSSIDEPAKMNHRASIRMKALRPCQRWNLITFDSNNFTGSAII